MDAELSGLNTNMSDLSIKSLYCYRPDTDMSEINTLGWFVDIERMHEAWAMKSIYEIKSREKPRK